MIMQLIAFVLIFIIASAFGVDQRIRWANAKRYNMPASQHPAFVAAHPDLVVPRPWSWRTVYSVTLVVWLGMVWALGTFGG